MERRTSRTNLPSSAFLPSSVCFAFLGLTLALPIKSDSSASCTVWPIVHSTGPNRDARHNLVGDERSAGADFMGKADLPWRIFTLSMP